MKIFKTSVLKYLENFVIVNLDTNLIYVSSFVIFTILNKKC